MFSHVLFRSVEPVDKGYALAGTLYQDDAVYPFIAVLDKNGNMVRNNTKLTWRIEWNITTKATGGEGR
ncbi:hypothetical protein [Thermococcus sp.]